MKIGIWLSKLKHFEQNANLSEVRTNTPSCGQYFPTKLRMDLEKAVIKDDGMSFPAQTC